jgi:sigma-54 specific flagellar transcriptional regulator A
MKGQTSPVDALIVGQSSAIQELRYLIRAVAPSDASVIVTGPSGSGKEMVARAVHAESLRGERPYIAVNTGAIPRDLLESELFGHEKGSFTGAIAQKRGRFEEAHGGTLFLDEIGDMPADMQVKLLRVLEERSVQRVGGRGEIAIDTRIISATHRNIDDAIQGQRFREDLFYRLAVFPIDLPSLADRREDVPLLVRHFLALAGEPVAFDAAAIDRLVAHNWPGNVRELRNVVERAAILFRGRTVGAEQVELVLTRRALSSVAERTALWEATEMAIAATVAVNSPAAASEEPAIGDGPVDLRKLMADLEYRYISEALRVSEGVVADAARLLTLQRTTLIEKMRKHGLAKAA